MKKNIFNITKWHLSVCALTTAVLLGSCTAETELQPVDNDQTPVEVTATVLGGTDKALTRAAADLQATAFGKTTAQLDGSKLSIMIDQNNGSYTQKIYNITNAASKTIALADGQTAATFPAGVNTVNVYGWYPQSANPTFTVNADQSGEDNYLLSDAMFAVSNTCTRVKNGNNWDVTAAALTFTHVMSKISLTITPGTGVAIKTIKLKSLYPTVVCTPVTSTNTITGPGLAAASGSATDITLYSNNSGSTSAVTCAGVFPPQSVTSSANFVEVTATYGGQEGTITYKLSANTTFATGNVYSGSATINGGTNVTTGTITITNWTSGSALTINPDKPSL